LPDGRNWPKKLAVAGGGDNEEWEEF